MSVRIERAMAADGDGVVHLRSSANAVWTTCAVPWAELRRVTIVQPGEWLCGECWTPDLQAVAWAGRRQPRPPSWTSLSAAGDGPAGEPPKPGGWRAVLRWLIG